MAPVDMRKSINGLAALVENELALSPMMEVLFVFCNRGRIKIKLLYWERNGFVVWYKRLEKQHLFDKRDLMALLRGDPSNDRLPDINQLKLI
ncbi:transposase [Zhongshania antarctica]|uniref:Transposase n=2 Tax=Zhongshania antarctica TaxID=641702 RepID=A0A840R977_9GAMM|nr:transposase [Zhongshania antarctica]